MQGVPTCIEHKTKVDSHLDTSSAIYWVLKKVKLVCVH